MLFSEIFVWDNIYDFKTPLIPLFVLQIYQKMGYEQDQKALVIFC